MTCRKGSVSITRNTGVIDHGGQEGGHCPPSYVKKVRTRRQGVGSQTDHPGGVGTWTDRNSFTISTL